MKGRLYFNRANPFLWLSVLLMAASGVFRYLYYDPASMDQLHREIYYDMMLGAVVIFIFVVVFLAVKCPQLTVIPVTAGVLFFAFKAFSFESPTHTYLCLALYGAVLVLYWLTIFELIPFPYLLWFLFGLPLLYHLFVEDWNTYFFAEPAVPFREWFPELSVLCIMAGLLCLSFSIKYRYKKVSV